MEALTKLVDVVTRRPIRFRNKIVRGISREELTLEEIRGCIDQHAVVTEILGDGRRAVLTYENYNKNVLTGEEYGTKPEEAPAKVKEKVEEVKEDVVEEETTAVEETEEPVEEKVEEVETTTKPARTKKK